METGREDLQSEAREESPAKKSRTDTANKNGGESELTLDSIRQAFRTELGRKRAICRFDRISPDEPHSENAEANHHELRRPAKGHQRGATGAAAV